MKPNSTVRRLLLVAADSSFESDFLAALRVSMAAQSSAAVFELVHFPLAHVAVFFLVLDPSRPSRQGEVGILRGGLPGTASSYAVQITQCSHRRTGSFMLALRAVGPVLVETTRSYKGDAMEPRVGDSHRSKTSSFYIGPFWSDSETDSCTTAPFLDRARVCRSMSRSKERMRRRTSCPHPLSHGVRHSGICAWPM